MLNSAKRLSHYSSGLKGADVEASDCRTGQAGEEQAVRVPAEALLGIQSAVVFNPLPTPLKKNRRCLEAKQKQHRKGSLLSSQKPPAQKAAAAVQSVRLMCELEVKGGGKGEFRCL